MKYSLSVRGFHRGSLRFLDMEVIQRNQQRPRELENLSKSYLEKCALKKESLLSICFYNFIENQPLMLDRGNIAFPLFSRSPFFNPPRGISY